jgi:RsiW-degrading membrane proteinase PrsW (M82 family)
MQQGLLLLPVVVPVFFWAAYHYYKDRDLPEPPGNLLLCFVLGLFAAGLSKAMYIGLELLGLRFDAVALAANNGPGLFAYALLGIGPIEELAKMIPFLLVVVRFKAFDDSMDGITYASFRSRLCGPCHPHRIRVHLGPLDSPCAAGWTIRSMARSYRISPGSRPARLL